MHEVLAESLALSGRRAKEEGGGGGASGGGIFEFVHDSSVERTFFLATLSARLSLPTFRSSTMRFS